MSAASWAWVGGSSGQRCLAISSALTNTLPRSSGASVSSTKVDLPAPLGPATRSRRFTGRLGLVFPSRPASTLGHQDRTAVGSVLDDVAVVVEGDCGEAGRSV